MQYSVVLTGKIGRKNVKFTITSILLLLSFSLIMGEQTEKYKLSGNLGVINGASVGTGWVSKKNPNRETYLNLVYFTTGPIWYTGFNGEYRAYGRSNFYTLVSGGIDYCEIDDLGSPGGTDPSDSHGPYSFVYPHVTVGVGYRMDLGKDAHLFIEWDIGCKASITNINIGIKM